MTFTHFIVQDWASNRRNTKGRLVTLLFRIANYSTQSRVARFVLMPYIAFYRLLVEWVLGIELPPGITAGAGLTVYHGQALVVHRNTKLGTDCVLRHSTTIGNTGKTGRCPVIGNRVDIGANVCIIGPITVGDDVRIGAGAVVVKSVPANSIVVGNPARILRRLPQPSTPEPNPHLVNVSR